MAPKLTSPQVSYDYLMQIWDKGLLNLQEQVYVVYMNRNSEVIGWHCLHTGTTASVELDIKLTIAIGLKCLSSNIIIAHNHPGRVRRPSQGDIDSTRKLDTAAMLFDIRVLDHIIVFDDGFYSMKEHRLL